MTCSHHWQRDSDDDDIIENIFDTIGGGGDDSPVRVLLYEQDKSEIQRLLSEGSTAAKKRGDCSMFRDFTAVAAYHSLITGESRKPRMQASVAVASIMYHRGEKETTRQQATYKYKAEKIRSNLLYFVRHRCLPADTRGKGVSNVSRIHDAEFRATCRSVIAGLETDLHSKEWSARDFRLALIKRLTEDGTLSANGRGISTATVCFYLRYLGMVLVEPKKGIYKDGHERPDVVEYRKEYLRYMKELESRMQKVLSDCDDPTKCKKCNAKGCVTLQDPEGGLEDLVVPVYHDECIFAAHEGRFSYWGRPGDRLFKKSKGKCQMVSGFICPCHGRMEVSEDDVPAFEAFAKSKFPDVKFKFSQITDESGKVVGYHSFTTITPGKNDFGWWCGEHVVEQTAEVIVIFEFLHSR